MNTDAKTQEQSKLSALRANLRDAMKEGATATYTLLMQWVTDGTVLLLFPDLAKLDMRETVDGVPHKNVLVHTLEVMNNVHEILKAQGSSHPNDGALVLGSLLHDIGKISTKKFDSARKAWTYYRHEEVGYDMMKPVVYEELQLDAEAAEVVLAVIRYHQLPGQLEEIGDKGLRRFCQKIDPHMREVLIIAKADSTSNNPMKVLKCRQKVDDLAQKLEEFRGQEIVRLLRVAITNAEIVELLGVSVKVAAGIKDMLKELVLAGRIENDVETLYDYLERKFKHESVDSNS